MLESLFDQSPYSLETGSLTEAGAEMTASEHH